MSSQIDFKPGGEEESMLPDQEARVREEEKDALLENTLHHLQKGYNCDLSQRFVLHIWTKGRFHKKKVAVLLDLSK